MNHEVMWPRPLDPRIADCREVSCEHSLHVDVVTGDELHSIDASEAILQYAKAKLRVQDPAGGSISSKEWLARQQVAFNMLVKEDSFMECKVALQANLAKICSEPVYDLTAAEQSALGKNHVELYRSTSLTPAEVHARAGGRIEKRLNAFRQEHGESANWMTPGKITLIKHRLLRRAVKLGFLRSL